MREQHGPGFFTTHLSFSCGSARRALERATREDVCRGGVYDVQGDGAVSIWTQPWTEGEDGAADQFVGTIFWGQGSADDEVVVFALQVGPAATLGDVYGRLATLFGHPLPARAVA